VTGLLSVRLALEEALADVEDGVARAEIAQDHAQAALEAAPGRAAWACREGCAWCCHLKVLVHPAEAMRIAAHVRTTWSGAERAALHARLPDARGPCPFLNGDARCAIYALRPIRCRTHVSTDAGACERGLDPLPGDGWLAAAGHGLHAALGDATLEELREALRQRLD
jgi:Fe-S-cluster containining protein